MSDEGVERLRKILDERNKVSPSPHQFIGVCLSYSTPQPYKSVKVDIMSCVVNY